VAWYCDTSALVKLVLTEQETGAIEDAVESGNWQLVTSELTVAELGRAARRGGPEYIAKARVLLDSGIDILRLSRAIFERAAELDPPGLRTLDAIHLASALSLGTACNGVVTYDARMQQAARIVGLTVVAPGRDG
jgi:predicted nucleic acid-binding protein